METIPSGLYTCTVKEVRVETTPCGDPKWIFRLVVAEGEYQGHEIDDFIVFSSRGRHRVRATLKALGVSSPNDILLAAMMGVDTLSSPNDILHRRVVADVRRVVAATDDKSVRNEVAYAGYSKYPEEVAS